MSDPGSRRPPRARGHRRRRIRRRWLIPAVLVVVLVLVGAGAVAVALIRAGPEGAGGSPTSSTSFAASPAAPASPERDLTRLSVRRGPLCGAVRAADVRAALAAQVARSSGYGPGQRVLLAPGVRDVSHEYACVFRARTGAQARVWVFASPVTRRTADRLVTRSGAAEGCRPADVASGFGAPSAGTLCPGPRRPGRDLVARGLFGDAYLTCELVTTGRETADEAVRRADDWCAGVGAALGRAP